jgi:hypothetical protein
VDRLMNIILKDIEPDDWILAIRAAKYLKERFQQDAWIAYGEGTNAKEFYAKRNKKSITVRSCYKLSEAAE